jgi:hypothetical protein
MTIEIVIMDFYALIIHSDGTGIPTDYNEVVRSLKASGWIKERLGNRNGHLTETWTKTNIARA